jgi:outer membrane protein assembly factor BamB
MVVRDPIGRGQPRAACWAQAWRVAALLAALGAQAAAENWPAWRGPRGNGMSNEVNVPLLWSERRSVQWKVELPGTGASSPCVWEGSVFVTSQDGDKLLLLRIDAATGQIVWSRQVGVGRTPRDVEVGLQRFHPLHNLASPSPATDGEVVVAHFGNGELAVYDFEGQLLWRRNLQTDHGPYRVGWGHANSPVIAGDVVIVCALQAPDEAAERPSSYVAAYDLKTGRQRWIAHRTTDARGEEHDAYTTPALRRTAQGVELVVMGGNLLDAYDPASGRRHWFLPGLRGGRTVASPLTAGEFVVGVQGDRGPLLVVHPGRTEGELPRRAIVWKQEQGTPDVCSPVVWADLLLFVTNDGTARCFDGRNGKLYWTHALRGEYMASPVAADGRVYFLNRDGLCTVVSAHTRFHLLAENQLDDAMLASPALSGGRFYFRGARFLYCIRK